LSESDHAAGKHNEYSKHDPSHLFLRISLTGLLSELSLPGRHNRIASARHAVQGQTRSAFFLHDISRQYLWYITARFDVCFSGAQADDGRSGRIHTMPMASRFYLPLIAWMALVCLVGQAPAPPQRSDEAAIKETVQGGLDAYQRKDVDAMFSLFSSKLPFVAAFKWDVQNDLATLDKIEIKNVTFRKLLVKGDVATLSLAFDLFALNKGTGEPDKVSGRKFHTYQLVKENGVWKLSSFSDDEERLALELAAARTDEERNSLIAAAGPLVNAGLANQLVGRGDNLIDKGNYATASTVFRLAEKIAGEVNDKMAMSASLYGLGHISLVLGNQAQAADYFARCLAGIEALANKSFLAFALSRIGWDYSDRGDYIRAMDCYEKCMRISSDSGNRIQLATVLEWIGDLFARQHNDDQALNHYRQCLSMFEQIEATFDLKAKVADVLGRIAGVISRRGEYDQAAVYYQRILKLTEESGSKEGVAGSLLNLGLNLHMQGNLIGALDYYQRSLALWQESGHKPNTAQTLSLIGIAHLNQHNYSQAVEYCERAAAVARDADSASIPAWMLTALGNSYLAAGRDSAAREAFTAAIASVEGLRARVAGGELDQELFFQKSVDPYYVMVELLVKQRDYAGALTYAERAKGRVLLDVLQKGREDITASMTADELIRERTLNAAITALNARSMQEGLAARPDQGRISKIDSQLKKARLDYEAFQTGLYTAHPDLGARRGETAPESLAEIAGLIPDKNTAFLEYVVTGPVTYLFVIFKPDTAQPEATEGVSIQVFPIAINSRDLTRLAAEFRERLAGNSAAFREPARRLYDLLLGPAAALLAGKNTVCVVPDGPLWELPFQALLTGRNEFFLQSHALFYSPSLSTLELMIRNRSQAHGTPGAVGLPLSLAIGPGANSEASQVLFAVGNPALNSNPALPGSIRGDLPYHQLPQAEQEVKTLARIYGLARSRILTGADAREETVKSEIGQYKILHFATHGSFDDQSPLYSRLLLANSASTEDGVLEAREIMQLKLHADLAVLSACQTGRGSFRPGEGLIGMAWALFIAGTPTTVASQWKVDSASTSALMIAFHRDLESHLSPEQRPIAVAQTLRRAALKLMSQPRYRHPFYWAGFVVMGNGL
jgi:CHAT domain-containing protein/Tfp pilus assembly protein PilF